MNRTLVTVSLHEIMAVRAGTVDPSRHPDEVFELYSIPAFDNGVPDVLAGSEIGSSKQVVEPGDVLLSKIVPHIRRAWVVGPKNGSRIIASSEWIVFRSERFVPEYLRHVLMGDPFHAQFMKAVSGVGGSLLRARPAHVAAIKIPLPSRTEQRRIAGILDEADALRRKRAEAIRLANDLVPSLFHEMFGDHKSNPNKWPVQCIGDFAEVGTGTTPSRAVPEYYGGTIPWVKTTEVQGTTIYDTEEKLTKAGFEAGRSKLYPPGSIVVALYGQGKTRGQVAKLAVPATTNQACAVILPNDRYETEYLLTFLRSSYEAMRSMSRGGNQQNLNLELIRSIRVLLPPLALQRSFVRTHGSLDQIRDAQAKSETELDNLFHSLLQRAFRGEL